jgi:outer membrane lipoprotein-sorting protein
MKKWFLVTGSIFCLLFFSGCLSGPVQEPSPSTVATRFLEKSDNLSAYRLNATITAFQDIELHTYHVNMTGIRPDMYDIEWRDSGGNTSDLFITNGTIDWHILPVANMAYYSHSDFLSRPTGGYDIMSVVSDLVRQNNYSIVRNSTIEERGRSYGIGFESEYYAGMKNCSIIIAINRQTYLPDRMQVFGSTGSLQQDIIFNDIEKYSSLQTDLFEYTPPDTIDVISNPETQTSPLYPLYFNLVKR